MLTFALFLSSALGFIQEWTYRTYGKDWQESLFYTHALALPWFALLLKDIGVHFERCSWSPPVSLLGGVVTMPWLWFLVALNLVSQYVCIIGVYRLTSTAGTLSCTLTITIRKFLSLVLSILYFNNPFTTAHWIGAIFVFVGTTMYSTSPAVSNATTGNSGTNNGRATSANHQSIPLSASTLHINSAATALESSSSMAPTESALTHPSLRGTQQYMAPSKRSTARSNLFD
jgi:hypothetical protein